MKLKLTDNLFLKIISVLAAVVLWMVVVIISDAESTDTFPAEVTLRNTNVVTENGKVFWVEDGTNFVKVTVRARRSVLEGLKQSDFIVTADMEKDLKYIELFELYQGLLTERQREIFSCHYCLDLSLAEIAEQIGISRQGVRDLIKKAEDELLFLEEKLGLAKKMRALRSHADNMVNIANTEEIPHSLRNEIKEISDIIK